MPLLIVPATWALVPEAQFCPCKALDIRAKEAPMVHSSNQGTTYALVSLLVAAHLGLESGDHREGFSLS